MRSGVRSILIAVDILFTSLFTIIKSHMIIRMRQMRYQLGSRIRPPRIRPPRTGPSPGVSPGVTPGVLSPGVSPSPGELSPGGNITKRCRKRVRFSYMLLIMNIIALIGSIGVIIFTWEGRDSKRKSTMLTIILVLNSLICVAKATKLFMKGSSMQQTVIESKGKRRVIHYLNMGVTMISFLPIILYFVYLKRPPKFKNESSVEYKWWPKDWWLPHQETIQVTMGVGMFLFALWEYTQFRKNERRRQLNPHIRSMCGLINKEVPGHAGGGLPQQQLPLSPTDLGPQRQSYRQKTAPGVEALQAPSGSN